jgi:NTE family protein
MTPQHVISQLLESDTKYPKNLDLLKKIILTTYLGRFRINGLAPDKKITLGNYLFDEERVLFDFTRLNDEMRTRFFRWLLEPHQQEKQDEYFSSVYVNEYRGFTAEVTLSLWSRLTSWFANRRSEYWKISDLTLSLNYQLTGIELCHGTFGTLIGFKQLSVPPSGTKYKDPKDLQAEPLGNVKRVYITDRLVHQLMQINPQNISYESVCKSAHPQSIDVLSQEARHKEMQAHRKTQKFEELQPWYVRAWNWFSSWISSWFPNGNNDVKAKPRSNGLTLLYENESVKIYQRDLSKELLVKEKKPDLTNLVLCGGGGKIFAHIGVWKALCEAKIRPVNFSGSSAGAIMVLLCYLGFSADEISDLFKHFKQEHLVFYDIDRNGLSDPHSLKTALDYAIALKIKQIVTQYKIPYPQGKITFKTLDTLRQQCPDCGFGNALTVTATRKKLRQTRYFSLLKTPNMEVSDAVKTSASFPVVFRGTLIDGEEHNDGGVLSNFPTEVFPDDHSTLLESEYGNNLKVLAVQFDNGTERTAVDRTERVYRENFLLNWIYSWLTGVRDPASAWEQDRLKLRKYASQSIVVNVENISSSSFTVEEETRNKVIQNGYEPTKNYLDLRYSKKNGTTNKNQEIMYSTFSSLGDLLSYCCYRGDHYWFEIVNNLIVQSSLPNRTTLMKQSLELRKLYFNSVLIPEKIAVEVQNPVTFFGNTVPADQVEIAEENHNTLLAIYPILLKISPELFSSTKDRKNFEAGRHSITLHSPFRCLNHFNKINGDTHIFVHLFINLLKQLQENPEPKLYDAFKELQTLLYSDVHLLKPEYYGKWDLSASQCFRVLKLFKENRQTSASQLFACLKIRSEPLQIIKDGTFCDDFTIGNLEENNLGYNAPGTSS